MKKFNIIKAAASGVFNLFKLENENQLLVIHFKLENYLLPIIGKKIFINVSKHEEEIESLFYGLQESKLYKNLDKIKIVFGVTPEYSKNIIASIGASGVCFHSSVKEYLISCGFKFHETTLNLVKRDFTDLLSSNKDARENLESNLQKLQNLNINIDSFGIEVKNLAESLRYINTQGAIFAGPPGTGKTWACYALAAYLNAPYIEMQLDAGIIADALKGAYAQKEDGHWTFLLGPFLVAFTQGWVSIWNELNYSRTSVQSVFNQGLDDTDTIIVEGVTYKRNPNFIALFTINPGRSDTEEIPEALQDRVKIICVPDLTKEEYTNRLINYSKFLGHSFPKEFYEKIYDFGNKIGSLAPSFHENCTMSLRHGQKFVSDILLSRKTLNDFKALLAINFINHLTVNNDNVVRVENLKKDPSLNAQMEELYSLYDFAEVASTEAEINFGDLFEESSAESDSDDDILSDLDDIEL